MIITKMREQSRIKLLFYLIIYFVFMESIIGLLGNYTNALYIVLVIFNALIILFISFKFKQNNKFIKVVFFSAFFLAAPLFLTKLAINKTKFETLFVFFDRYQTIETRIKESYTEKLYPTQGIYGSETNSERVYEYELVKQGIFTVDADLSNKYEDFFNKNEVVLRENYFFKTVPYILGFKTDLKTVDIILLPLTFLTEFIVKSIPLTLFVFILDTLLCLFLKWKSILRIFEPQE